MPEDGSGMHIQLLYFADCPSHEEALTRLQQALAATGVAATLDVHAVTSHAEAEQLRFVGSPTILIDGHDMVPPDPQATYALTCRAYTLENGRISPLPSAAMLRAALVAAGSATT